MPLPTSIWAELNRSKRLGANNQNEILYLIEFDVFIIGFGNSITSTGFFGSGVFNIIKVGKIRLN